MSLVPHWYGSYTCASGPSTQHVTPVPPPELTSPFLLHTHIDIVQEFSGDESSANIDGVLAVPWLQHDAVYIVILHTQVAAHQEDQHPKQSVALE